MTNTQVFDLADIDIRVAILEYIEREYDIPVGTLKTSDLRFGVTQGYGGEQGGPSTPNKVTAHVKVVK